MAGEKKTEKKPRIKTKELGEKAMSSIKKAIRRIPSTCGTKGECKRLSFEPGQHDKLIVVIEGCKGLIEA